MFVFLIQHMVLVRLEFSSYWIFIGGGFLLKGLGMDWT